MSGSSDPGGPQYITPIGPFCPFRSEATKLDGTVDSGMGSLTSKSQSFMAEMARLQPDSPIPSPNPNPNPNPDPDPNPDPNPNPNPDPKGA